MTILGFKHVQCHIVLIIYGCIYRYFFGIVISVHKYEQDKIYGNETSDFNNN
jgi:hypothetical protein